MPHQENRTNVNNQPVSFFQSLNEEAGNLSSITKALEQVDKINNDDKNPININLSDLLSDSAGGTFQMQLAGQTQTRAAATQAPTATTPEAFAAATEEAPPDRTVGQRIGAALQSFGQSPDLQAGALSLATAIGGGERNLSSTGLGGFIDVLRSGAEAGQLRQSLLAADEQAGGGEDSPISSALNELPSFGLTRESVLEAFNAAQGIQQQQQVSEATEVDIENARRQQDDKLEQIRVQSDEAIRQIRERAVVDPTTQAKIESDIALNQSKLTQINAQIERESNPDSLQNLQDRQALINAELQGQLAQLEVGKELTAAQVPITIQAFRDFTQDLPDIFRAEAIFGEDFDFKPFSTPEEILGAVSSFRVVDEGDPRIAEGKAITQATKDQLLRRFTALQNVIPVVQRSLGAGATPPEVSRRIKERFVFGSASELGLRQTADTVTDNNLPVFRNEAGEAFTEFSSNAFVKLIVKGEGR